MLANNDRKSLWIGLTLLLLVAAISIYLVARDGKEAETTSDQNQSSQSEQSINSDSEITETNDATIEFNNNGFDRDEYTVKPGATVLVRNNSSQPVQFSSDSHPTHRDTPELNRPAIDPGQTTTVTAPIEPGEYGFHDHIDERHSGVIIVR